MATTGSSFAAVHAGMMPASNPTEILMLSPRIIMEGESTTLKGNAALKPTLIKNTRNNPINPPRIQSKEDSSKNSVRMVDRLAPIAFLSPI